MAINLSELNQYVEEQRLPLIKKAVLGTKTLDYINLQAGVKGSAALNLLNVTPTLQKGNSCGFSAQGDVAYSQRKIETGLIKVNMEFCAEEMRDYWCNYELKLGAGKENLPFSEYITNAVIENVNNEVERLIWLGQTEYGDAFDGLTKFIGGSTASENSSAYDGIKNLYKRIPVEVLPKAVIFVGADTFRYLMMEMVEKNLFHYPANGAQANEIIFPGTNTKVVAINGLNGSQKIVAGDPQNLFYGCDLMDDKEDFDLFYDKGSQTWKLVIKFNAGTQIAYPNEVVSDQLMLG